MTSLNAISADITTLDVDAIVNAANSSLAGGGGVDGAIHRAGGPTLLEQCQAWVADNGPMPTGKAMVTDGGLLTAGIVIHTVGPVWFSHEPDEARRLLADCYRNSLELARENGCASVAFPNISTGAYGFPKQPAAQVAIETVREATQHENVIDRVIFCCFSEENLRIYEELLEG